MKKREARQPRASPASHAFYHLLKKTCLTARRAGGTWDDVVRERVLEPLGMRMTSTVAAGEMAEWNTQGY